MATFLDLSHAERELPRLASAPALPMTATTEVVVTGVRIPFASMVGLAFRCALASLVASAALALVAGALYVAAQVIQSAIARG